MSRPPPNHQQQLSAAYSRNNLIDFVHVPQVPLGQAYEEGFHPSIYAQAGFPGYAVPGYANAAENIINVGGVDHLVVQDVFRTGYSDYWALKLA